MMKPIRNKREATFYDCKWLGARIQALAGFVQNDFDLMLEDGTVNIEDLKKGRKDAADAFKQAIFDLAELRKRQLEVVDEAITETENKQGTNY